MMGGLRNYADGNLGNPIRIDVERLRLFRYRRGGSTRGSGADMLIFVETNYIQCLSHISER